MTMREVFPAPRSRHTAATINNDQDIIVYGGGGKNKIFGDIWILNVAKMQWSQPQTRGAKPSPRWGHSCSIVNSKMYVYGGVYDSKMLNELYELDTSMCTLLCSKQLF